MTDDPEVQIHRIHGDPEQWLREFLEKTLPTVAGRVYGVCVHLEVHSDVDPDSSGTIAFIDWPSTSQLQGRLMTTVTRLALRHLDLPERGGSGL